MTSDGGNTSITNKNIKAKGPKVYDLDSAPSFAGFDSAMLANALKEISTQSDAEVPRGMLLHGYDHVGEAVAELENTQAANPQIDARATKVEMKLPSELLIAGDPAWGMIEAPSANERDTLIYLYSSNTRVVRLPESVMIPAGRTQVQFPIATSNPGRGTTRVTIQAMLPGEMLFSSRVAVRYNLGLRVR